MQLDGEDDKADVRCHRSSGCKWRSTRQPEWYDRPGREYKAEKRYRNGKTHTGKGKTLRSHRP